VRVARVKNEKKKQEKEKKKKEKDFVYTPGCIVNVKELDETKPKDRANISTQFQQCGPVKFVDIQEKEIFVRFLNPEAGKKALSADCKFLGESAKISLLEGDEEKKYYDEKVKKSSHEKSHRKGRGGRKKQKH